MQRPRAEQELGLQVYWHLREVEQEGRRGQQTVCSFLKELEYPLRPTVSPCAKWDLGWGLNKGGREIVHCSSVPGRQGHGRCIRLPWILLCS